MLVSCRAHRVVSLPFYCKIFLLIWSAVAFLIATWIWTYSLVASSLLSMPLFLGMLEFCYRSMDRHVIHALHAVFAGTFFSVLYMFIQWRFFWKKCAGIAVLSWTNCLFWEHGTCVLNVIVSLQRNRVFCAYPTVVRYFCNHHSEFAKL